MDNQIKYACVGGPHHMENLFVFVNSHWLPRWYKVPFNECIFIDKKEDLAEFLLDIQHLIILTPRNNGNYEEHLAEQKLKHLLEKA